MRRLGNANSDVTLVLDRSGVIQEARVSRLLADEPIATWIGKLWSETVGDGQGAVQRILEDARDLGIAAYEPITQQFPSGLELPIEYTAVRLSGRRNLLAVGREVQALSDLRARLSAAQQATEREYWKLRDMEQRYRSLFDTSREAVLTLAADGTCILEANPVALRVLGLAPGSDFLAALLGGERESFCAGLTRARQEGRAPGSILRIGAERTRFFVRLSLIPNAGGPTFLVQMASLGEAGLAELPKTRAAPDVPVAIASLPGQLIARMPDAFVAIDEEATIVSANSAFIDLVQVASEGAVLGQKLSRWLVEPGADAGAVLLQVRAHRRVRLLATVLQGELGSRVPVEISAAFGQGTALIGVLLRDVSHRLAAGSQTEAVNLDALDRAGLAGVIRGLAGAMERRYIAAALARAGGNRTIAARLLGVSRQNLHARLGRLENATLDGEV
jgi:transcriptional regulator PpsR